MPLTRYRLPTVIVLNLLTLFHYSKAADLTGVDLQNTLMAPKCAQNDNLNKNGTDGYGQVFQFQSYDICNVFLFSLALCRNDTTLPMTLNNAVSGVTWTVNVLAPNAAANSPLTVQSSAKDATAITQCLCLPVFYDLASACQSCQASTPIPTLAPFRSATPAGGDWYNSSICQRGSAGPATQSFDWVSTGPSAQLDLTALPRWAGKSLGNPNGGLSQPWTLNLLRTHAIDTNGLAVADDPKAKAARTSDTTASIGPANNRRVIFTDGISDHRGNTASVMSLHRSVPLFGFSILLCYILTLG